MRGHALDELVFSGSCGFSGSRRSFRRELGFWRDGGRGLSGRNRPGDILRLIELVGLIGQCGFFFPFSLSSCLGSFPVNWLLLPV